MTRRMTSILLLAVLAAECGRLSATEPKTADSAETKYLTFQLMTGLYGYAGPRPMPGHYALSKAQLAEFVRDVVQTIGVTGDVRRKLGFAVGPLCFDMSDEETRQFIHDAFAVARENDVAVAFHIDDSMCWGQRRDLLSNPDNIETADWKQIPNTGRRADWGPKPTKFPPQMCFNSPDIQAAVEARAALIGAEVKRELATLKSSGQEHLFAGVIAGWETQMGRDFDTDRPLGYRALSHRGFSERRPPKDADLERVSVVKEFIELWANALHAAGVPREKTFCHIVFTSQGLDPKNLKTGGGSKFSPVEVAFSSAYRPGFSTYPEGSTFKAINAALAEHGSPGWISGEGTNVSPTGMPGEANMETYLGRMFNHGAVMTNIFSWGIGGDALRSNFFRRATEGPEALAAYAKFLRGESLIETAASGFSAANLQDKMQRIQKALPGWVQTSGQQAQATALMQKIKGLVKDKKWQEVDKVADQILALISSGEKTVVPDEEKTRAPGEEGRAHLLHALGGPFFVSRDKVQEDLQLSDDQKHKLREKLSDDVLETKRVQSLTGSEREQAMRALRQKSYEKLELFLKEIFTPEQLKRFEQLKLQYNVPSILVRPEIVNELKITDEQRQQFIGAIQEMQQEIAPLMKAAKSGGNPREILPKVIQLRRECESKIEALMTNAQKQQWKAKTGTQLDIW
jgi:hypothetical protein